MVQEQPIPGRYQELEGPLVSDASSLPDLSITLVPTASNGQSTGCASCCRFYPQVPSPEWLTARPPTPQLLHSVAELLPSESNSMYHVHPLDAAYPAILMHSTAFSYLTYPVYSATVAAYNEAARDTPGARHRRWGITLLFILLVVATFQSANLGRWIGFVPAMGIFFPICAVLAIVSGVVLGRTLRTTRQTLVQRVCAVLREANGELQRKYQRARGGEGSALRLAQWRWVTEKRLTGKGHDYVLCLVDIPASELQLQGVAV